MAKVRGLSAERIAVGILEKLGFVVVQTSHKVKISDAEVVEIDIVAKKSGEMFAVEVRAGKVDVSSIRHAYANASLVGYKPMVVCKGFSDDAAKIVADELGVEVIELSEFYVLLGPEELETVVRTAIIKVMDEYGLRPIPPYEALSESDLKFLEMICKSTSLEDILRTMSEKQWGEKIRELRERDIFPRGISVNFKDIRDQAKRILSQYDIVRRLEKVEKRLKEIRKRLGE
ncbi:MAG: hypothetical protein QMC85_02455 [Methanocellales archaeon]|nr:hypothetical protein [Methanocellales archaeon]MDI6902925.1 hypothetical protein [Methanocellales archaeon]